MYHRRRQSGYAQTATRNGNQSKKHYQERREHPRGRSASPARPGMRRQNSRGPSPSRTMNNNQTQKTLEEVKALTQSLNQRFTNLEAKSRGRSKSPGKPPGRPMTPGGRTNQNNNSRRSPSPMRRTFQNSSPATNQSTQRQNYVKGIAPPQVARAVLKQGEVPKKKLALPSGIRAEGLHADHAEIRLNADMSRMSYTMKALMLPSDYRPIRWPNAMAATPTAVGNPRDRLDAGWLFGGAYNPLNQGMPENTMFGAAFRTPQRAFIVYDFNKNNLTWAYQWRGVEFTSATKVAPASSWTISLNSLRNDELIPIHIVTSTCTSPAYMPHGPIMYAGSYSTSDGRFFWCDGGIVTLNITVPNSTTAAKFNIVADMVTSQGVNECVSATTVSVASGAGNVTSTQTVTIADRGYYSLWLTPVVQDTATTAITYTGAVTINSFTVSGSTGCFCHRTLKDYNTMATSDGGMRINATALMYSNKSPIADLSGTIAAAQIPVGDFWYDYTSSLEKVLAVKDAVQMEAATGCYGYMKPSDIADFELQENVVVNNGIIYDSRYPVIDETSPAVVFYVSIPLSTAQNGLWTFCSGVEFQTTNQWLEVTDPPADEAGALEAFNGLKDEIQFCENPLHLSTMLSDIRREVSDSWNRVYDDTMG